MKRTKKSLTMTREWRRRLTRLAQDPARRRRVSQLLKRWWRDPAYRRRRKQAALRQGADPLMRRRTSRKLKARWQNPAYRRRMRRALRRGWRDHPRWHERTAAVCANLGPSLGAQYLRAALGDGWVIEHWTRAGVVDVAHPALRIAIEVDDIGHRRPQRIARDRRKECQLRRLGWTVFRVSEAGFRAAFGAKAGRP